MRLLPLVCVPLLLVSACRKPIAKIDYRQEMRNFVQGISAKAKAVNNRFIVIPQNGEQLLTVNGSADGTLVADYIAAIDGTGREDLNYGYFGDDIATDPADYEPMLAMMKRAHTAGVRPLVTDYCRTVAHVDTSYARNARYGFLGFAADRRELDNIPPYPATPFNSNSDTIRNLADARNFLYIINPEAYETREEYLGAIAATNYDVVIMDLFFNDGSAFTAAEINALKNKPAGGTRKIICYMSIGEAETYRYYWQPFWNSNPPSFIVAENPAWAGNVKVKYWDGTWQGIIYKNNNSYLNGIMTAGFDGVYLDIIDGFEYFEDLYGTE